MNKWDFLVIAGYFVILGVITYLTYSSRWASVFSTNKKVKWWLAGLSLFMAITSVDGGQIISGIIHEQGIWGLWLFWCSGVFIGVVPLLFAPLWAKLNFITDNEFTLLRFSGRGAKVLHQFRAIYVGGLVVALMLSLQVLGFGNILTLYFDISHFSALVISGMLLLVFALKNAFEHKLRTDAFHVILFVGLLFIGLFYVLHQIGGWEELLSVSKTHFPEKLKVFPDSSHTKYISTIIIYITVLWWSSQMFDGGGATAQRYFSTKGKWHTVKAAFTPAILGGVTSFMIVMIVLGGMVLEHNGMTTSGNPELDFIGYFKNNLPNGLKGFSLVAFFAAFITTAESLMNWGASYIVVDVYKNRYPERTERHYVVIGFMAMTFLALLSTIIAVQSNTLQGLIHLFFAISAGVAPVFILRWVWLRINAWSQLSAMISSLLYTKLFDFIFDATTFTFYHLDYNSTRLVVVTLLTTATWLIVTFLTDKNDEKTLSNFKAIIPQNHFSPSKIGWAFAVGIAYVVCMAMTYHVVLG